MSASRLPSRLRSRTGSIASLVASFWPFGRRSKANNGRGSAAFGTRGYAAALMNRLTGDFKSTGSADGDVWSALATIRSRARDLKYNSDYINKFIRLLRINVVGPRGFTLQARSIENGVEDYIANDQIEGAFREWMKPANCCVTENMSFREMCNSILETVAVDGEVFVRKVYDDSKFGFRLQLIPSDYIDENLNMTLQNGNQIRMGIELDVWNKPVAYHMIASINKDFLSPKPTGATKRFEASEIIHIHRKDRLLQTRGVSWLAPVLLHVKQLKAYEEASVINARISAGKMGFFYSDNPNSVEYTGDAGGGLEITAEPVVFEQLPAGLKFQGFTPEFPHAQHEMFVKSVLRGIASGLGVSYVTLANDLEGTSYSSVRAGLLDERDGYEELQQFLIDTFLTQIDYEVLYYAMLKKIVNLPFNKMGKFYNFKWVGRTWKWVDPLKDAEATKVMLQNGWTSNSEIVGEMGKDLNDIYRELQKEKQLQEKYGLNFESNDGQTDPGFAAGDPAARIAGRVA